MESCALAGKLLKKLDLRRRHPMQENERIVEGVRKGLC
jgi:hypothetical protein